MDFDFEVHIDEVKKETVLNCESMKLNNYLEHTINSKY